LYIVYVLQFQLFELIVQPVKEAGHKLQNFSVVKSFKVMAVVVTPPHTVPAYQKLTIVPSI